MSSSNPSESGPWWKQLNRYHWFVFLVASLAWMFDCLDQQLFILARNNAISTLLGDGADPLAVKAKGATATAIFVLGWATGGLIFGSVGDRIGRAKTLAITVVMYSVFTGLSSFARTVTEFEIFRFITGLGVGGVFGLAVALVADSLPEKVRPKALGMLQALSAVGNVTAGLCAMAVSGVDPKVSWKYLFWIGSVPAFLCIFIMLRLKEPEKWVQARAASNAVGGKKMGSYGDLFGDPRWQKSAILGMVLCIAGVVGLWGVGFFSPELVGPAMDKSLRAEGLAGPALAAAKGKWTSMNLIVQNIGAFLGMIAFSKLAHNFGRKKAFAVGFVCACAATMFFFLNFKGKSDIWMSAVMGFFQLGLFAGFAIYLPELFPTRLRSTGTSFCYNVGRFIAATGPFTLGVLQQKLGDKAVAILPATADAVAKADAKLGAFREAACWLSLIYLVGLVVLPFLPETKDQPLPEDVNVKTA
ncbi:MAG TPA: MFS transporter [Roseimicrobium sp.]|nr:MFS transporter [Roseimicrobium sp.]